MDTNNMTDFMKKVGSYLDDMIHEVESETHGKRPVLKDMKLGTMTFMLNHAVVQSEYETPIDLERIAVEASKVKRLRVGDDKSKKFGNSMPCKVNVVGKYKSVKLFRAGGMHMAGLKSGVQLADVMSVAFVMYDRRAEEVDADDKDNVRTLVQGGVQMMKWFSQVPYEVDLDALKALLLKSGTPCKYDRADKSPNLSLKHFRGKDASISVSRTGTLSFTGKKARSIIDVYFFIVDLLFSNRATLECPETEKPEKKRKRSDAEDDKENRMIRESFNIEESASSKKKNRRSKAERREELVILRSDLGF